MSLILINLLPVYITFLISRFFVRKSYQIRTAFFNEALFHFLSIDKGCSIIKKGQLNKNIKLSYKAPPLGLEPRTL